MFATMSTSATVAPRARVAPAPRRVARAAPLSLRAAHSRNGASRLASTPRLSLSRSRAAVVRAAGEDKPPLPKETFSNATKMRSEAQAPFRVARMFLFGAFGANATLGFGIAGHSTERCRELEPTANVVLHQGDVGEYLRLEDELF